MKGCIFKVTLNVVGKKGEKNKRQNAARYRDNEQDLKGYRQVCCLLSDALIMDGRYFSMI